MRISSLLLPFLLAACGRSEQERARAAEQRAVEAAPKFFCASGEGALVAQCTAERTRTARGWVMTLRHPDGHFRRLRVADDGGAMAAADGAERAVVTPTGETIEVAIGADRYHLPASLTR